MERLRVEPVWGDKRVSRPFGRFGYLHCVIRYYALRQGDVAIMKVRPSEQYLDKWRFVNFSHDELPYVSEIEVGYGQFEEFVLPWLKYETDKWSFRLLEKQQNMSAKVRVSFSNPKDGMIFLLYKDQIVSGEKLPNRRRKKNKGVVAESGLLRQT